MYLYIVYTCILMGSVKMIDGVSVIVIFIIGFLFGALCEYKMRIGDTDD